LVERKPPIIKMFGEVIGYTKDTYQYEGPQRALSVL
jgi:hypothetical protein